MRRKEKEIQERRVIESVIGRAMVCRLGLSQDNMPYVVPLLFAYYDNCLYFHSASEGRKIDIIRQNPHVCFEVDVDQELTEAASACKCSLKYHSVIGFGKAVFVEDLEEKQRALNLIMQRYTGKPWEYAESALREVAVIRVEVRSMTGKKSGY